MNLEQISTKELIDCYNELTEYLKKLKNQKQEVEKSGLNA